MVAAQQADEFFSRVMGSLNAAVGLELIGKGLPASSNSVDNMRLVDVNKAIREHGVETIGTELRGYMKDMKAIVDNA